MKDEQILTTGILCVVFGLAGATIPTILAVFNAIAAVACFVLYGYRKLRK